MSDVPRFMWVACRSDGIGQPVETISGHAATLAQALAAARTATAWAARGLGPAGFCGGHIWIDHSPLCVRVEPDGDWLFILSPTHRAGATAVPTREEVAA